MTLQKKKLGQKGEKQAKKLLQNKGYKFITANYHTRYGEIDLIFQDEGQLVFVEVKTRSSNILGNPEEAITKEKINHLRKAAHIFLNSNPKLPQFARFDAVSILGSKADHFVNISQ
ncbi:YraN family protein [Patescibacteria group bacterium]